MKGTNWSERFSEKGMSRHFVPVNIKSCEETIPFEELISANWNMSQVCTHKQWTPQMAAIISREECNKKEKESIITKEGRNIKRSYELFKPCLVEVERRKSLPDLLNSACQFYFC